MDKSDGEPCVPDLPCDNGNIYIYKYISAHLYIYMYICIHVYMYHVCIDICV
jgi:hypothetical protein